MHALPKRAHRWHRSAACGVHFALAAVQATQALLLTGTVALMMSLRETERPIKMYKPIAEQSEGETGRPERPVGADL